MRLSNKQMADTIMRNLNRQILQIQNRQQMIASGKKVNRPSDDPIGMGQILDFRRTLSSIDQYNRNIDHAKMRVELGHVHVPVAVIPRGNVGASPLHRVILEHRRHPDRCNAHTGQVVQLGSQARQVAAVEKALVHGIKPVIEAVAGDARGDHGSIGLPGL